MLSKAPAGILFPVAALVIAWRGFRRDGLSQQWLQRLIRSLVFWSIAAAAAFVLFWPAMWIAPLDTVKRMLGLVDHFARTPHFDNFFLGKHVHLQDPGLLFYPLSLAMRTTPAIWFGLLGALPLLFRPRRGYPPVGILWLCVLLYVAVMTLGAKKFERYLLPAYPILDLVAAAGWIWLVSAVIGRLRPRLKDVRSDDPSTKLRAGFSRPLQPGSRRKRLKSLLRSLLWWLLRTERGRTTTLVATVVLAALLQGVSALPYHPDYLVYANPLLGGPRQAVRWLPAGWGEGLKEAAAYLEEDPEAQVVALGGVPAFAPVFRGQAVPLTEAHLATADHVVLYISDLQADSPLAAQFYGKRQPVHTMVLHGVEYAWIYRQEPPDDHREFLRQEVNPEDAILTDAPLLAVRRYDGPAEVRQVTSTSDEAAIAQVLDGIVAVHDRELWYLSSEAASKTLYDAIRRQLDTTALQLEPPRTLTSGVVAFHYRVPADAQFRPTQMDHPVNTQFGQALRLTGYGLSSDQVEYPQAVELLLQWQAFSPPDRDYTAFVHLLDDKGHRWTQSDVLLTGDDEESTRFWPPGGAGITRHLLLLPAGIPPGHYTVATGLYDAQGERLPISSGGGTMLNLAEVEVTSPRVRPEPNALTPAVALRKPMWKGLTLWGASLPPGPLQPGAPFTLALDWWAEQEPGVDLAVRFELTDRSGKPLAQWVEPLAPYPTGRWFAGELVRALYDLSPPADLPSGEYVLTVSVHRQSDGAAGLEEPVELGALPVEARTHSFSTPSEMEHVADATFGGNIHLLGYKLETDELSPDSLLHLTLYWQTDEALQSAYKVFVHLVDGEGRLWGQRDQVPDAGKAPTAGWLPEEVIADEIVLSVGAETPPGRYQLLVGLYDAAGTRLPLPGGESAYPLVAVEVGR